MSKVKNNVAKQLISLTKDKPYIFNGSPAELDYLETAKEYPEFFITTEKAIFSWEMVKSFWKLELKQQFTSGLQEISVNTFFGKGEKAFEKKYGMSFPELNATHFGITLEAYNNLKNRYDLMYGLEVPNPFIFVPGFEDEIYSYPDLPYSLVVSKLFSRISLFVGNEYILHEY